DHLAALLRKCDRKRQTDVAEPDDPYGLHSRPVYGAGVAASSARRSARTIRSTSCSKDSCAVQPNRSRAFVGSPMLGVRSGARTSEESTCTYCSASSPTQANAALARSA